MVDITVAAEAVGRQEEVVRVGVEEILVVAAVVAEVTLLVARRSGTVS